MTGLPARGRRGSDAPIDGISSSHESGAKLIGAAGVILASLAGADEDAAVPAGRGLADLHIEMFAVQGDFAADGDAAEVRSHVVRAGFKAEGRRRAP